MTKCHESKILNKETGRCVLKTGKIGKKLLVLDKISNRLSDKTSSLDLLLKTHSLSLTDAKKICGYLKPKKLSPKKLSPKKLSPKKLKTPSPKKLSPKKLSPKKLKTPSPKKLKTPSPKKLKTPSPKKLKTPSPKKLKTPSPKKSFTTHKDYIKNIVGSAEKYKQLEDVLFKYIEEKKYDELADLIEQFVKNEDFVRNNFNAIISSLEDILNLTRGKRNAKDLREYATILLTDFNALESDVDEDDEADEDEYIGLPTGVVKSPSKKLTTPIKQTPVEKIKRRIVPISIPPINK